MTKSSISLIVLLFISSIAYNQEIIDKVIAVVGEKPILFSEVQSQKMHILKTLAVVMNAPCGTCFNKSS